MTRSSKSPLFLVALALLVASLENSSQNPFPLNLVRISTTSPAFESIMATRTLSFQATSTVLVASLSIGTPSQSIPMVLDTGSQLSWMSCDNKNNPRASFHHKRSTSFSYLPCKLKRTGYTCPSSTDNTLTPSCDLGNHLCVYSRSVVVGGRFVTENFTFPNHQTTPPVTLGCEINGDTRSGAGGVLGMNLGPLSFISQLKVQTFSYCVPKHTYNSKINPPKGILYLGPNPKSRTIRFKYVDLLPSNPLLYYSVSLIRINFGHENDHYVGVPKRDRQTIIDSATQFTYLVSDVYQSVTNFVSRLAGTKYPRSYDGFPLCFYGKSGDIGEKVGDVSFLFQTRPLDVSVFISKESLFVEPIVGSDVCCFTIFPSGGVFGNTSSNIIGNIHLQNLWVEYDPAKKQVGFAITLGTILLEILVPNFVL